MSIVNVWIASFISLPNYTAKTLGVYDSLLEAQNAYAPNGAWRKIDYGTYEYINDSRSAIVCLYKFRLQGKAISEKLAIYEKYKVRIDLAEHVESAQKVRSLVNE